MTVIQRTPWRYYLTTSLIVGGAFGLFVLIPRLIADRPIELLLIVAGAIILVLLVFGLVVAPLAYPPVSVDLASRTLRMRSREVPISSITQAWRRVGPVKGGGGVLFYRLRSDLGPRVRILVAGRGFPSLDTAGRQALLDLLRTAPIDDAPRADAHSQRWQRVGVRQMVTEMKRFGLDWTVGTSDEEILDEVATGERDPDLPLTDDRLR